MGKISKFQNDSFESRSDQMNLAVCFNARKKELQEASRSATIDFDLPFVQLSLTRHKTPIYRSVR